jgi:hypothetical protein
LINNFKQQTMKNLILILITTFSLSCCNKDEIKTPIEQLPPATTTGANTVGCLVNGEVLLPKGGSLFGPPVVTCYYQYLNGSYEFGLGYSNNQQNNQLRGVYLFTNKLHFVQGQTYTLSIDLQNNSAYAQYSPDTFLEGFTTNSQSVGQIKITKLDHVNTIISGTFWFDGINNNGQIIHITEGRFDMQYTP